MMIEHSLEAGYFSSPARQRGLSPCATKSLLGAVALFGLLAAAGCSGPDKNAGTDSQANPLEPSGPMSTATNQEPAPMMTAAQTPPAVPGGDAPNGLSVPKGVLDWRVIGVVDLPTSAQIRVIVGNDTAVEAARAGQTRPWPDGSMISHLVWAVGDNPNEPGTVVPGNFAALTLMVKDASKYARDGGWAYSRWTTPALLPPTAPDFDRACVNCHVDNASDNDFVFTEPGLLPAASTVSLSAPSPNKLVMPPDMLDWRVVGVAHPEGSIRVVIGNDVAVEAVRAGETNPWPENTALGHFVWAEGKGSANFEKAGTTDAVVPGGFDRITFMTKNSTRFEADGGWAYSVWATAGLRAPAPNFDRACVNCHTDSVKANDFVFTEPGALPDL